jgi:predicted nucleic acid-binding protein
MRDFLLDTQMIRYWYDTQCQQHTAVVGNINSLKAAVGALDFQPKLLVSIITLGEIEYGHRVQTNDHAADNAARRKFIDEQLPAAWDVTADTTEAYAEIRARLFKKYAPAERRRRGVLPEQLLDPATALSLQIQENDLWICAQAVAHGFVLVTNDRMRAIGEVTLNMQPQLMQQNWTKAGAAKIIS